ncbi:Bgt-50770 [Blumeria graminis f. sp. tritici]|uniref:Bgt-50770 n=1 Tax=Blumeria graminis f. sp. tritici TaxID=62690 RepID=A0A9X9L6V9_BLUGR|nr:Bgt-50770 [Blumeria graminis f. sp. tritici]
MDKMEVMTTTRFDRIKALLQQLVSDKIKENLSVDTKLNNKVVDSSASQPSASQENGKSFPSEEITTRNMLGVRSCERSQVLNCFLSTTHKYTTTALLVLIMQQHYVILYISSPVVATFRPRQCADSSSTVIPFVSAPKVCLVTNKIIELPST